MTDGASFGRSGGRGESLRRHNLALVLRQVTLAPATRSELTRTSGLNRSTIGALVTELVGLGLVLEDESGGGGQVGRPSLLVQPSDAPVALAVNPEVDAITVAAVRLGGRVLRKIRIQLDEVPSAERASQVATEAAGRITAELDPAQYVIGAGVAVPGIVRREDGFVRLAPHLRWRDEPFADRLAQALGVPVAAANDASVGAYAEWIYGAGRGVDDLVYLNGGASGIGGAVISGGVLLRGFAGHAGEIGHATIRAGGAVDTVGVRGTLESQVRRVALLDVLGLDDADPDHLESVLLHNRTAAVARVVTRQIEDLGTALGSAVCILNPRRIVLGGFLAALLRYAPERLGASMRARTASVLAEGVDIRAAELGSDLLMVGAAELSFARVMADPAGTSGAAP